MYIIKKDELVLPEKHLQIYRRNTNQSYFKMSQRDEWVILGNRTVS